MAQIYVTKQWEVSWEEDIKEALQYTIGGHRNHDTVVPCLNDGCIHTMNRIWQRRKVRQNQAVKRKVLFQYIEHPKSTSRNEMRLSEIGVKWRTLMQRMS